MARMSSLRRSRSHSATGCPNSSLNRSRNTVSDWWQRAASSPAVRVPTGLFPVMMRTISLKPPYRKSGRLRSTRRKSASVRKQG